MAKQHHQGAGVLGPCNYYHQLVLVFVEVAELLYWLLQVEPFQGVAWLEECEGAFMHLKVALTSMLVLIFPNFKAPFYLHTNTSKLAIMHGALTLDPRQQQAHGGLHKSAPVKVGEKPSGRV